MAHTPLAGEPVVPAEAPRPRRPWRIALTAALAVAALVVGGVLVATIGGTDSSRAHVAAPTVAVGDVDAVVLSTTFDEDGARATIPADVLDAVRHLDGVAGAEGTMRRFVEVIPPDLMGSANAAALPPASARSAIAMSWEQGTPLAFTAGRAPAAAGEVAVNQGLADRYGLTVGSDAAVRTGPMQYTCEQTSTRETAPTCRLQDFAQVFHVVGVFALDGGDVTDTNLAVLGAPDLAQVTGHDGYDRLDVVAAPGVTTDDLLQRIAAVLPAGTMVVPPSVIGDAAQLRAELEIQRDYHWLLDPDRTKRSQAMDGDPNPGSEQTYQDHLSETVNTELRVSRVSFVDPATALVTYRVFYGGGHSSVAPDVLHGVALLENGAWRISRAGICELAHLSNIACDAPPGPDPGSLVVPPDGWNAPDSVVGAVAALRVLADPTSSVDQRIAAVDGGADLRAVVAAGVAADAPRAGAVEFRVIGARLLDATHAQVLYSVLASGDPVLETPYPLGANAILVDGTWRAAAKYACGLSALAAMTCPGVPPASVPSTTATPTTLTPTTMTPTTMVPHATTTTSAPTTSVLTTSAPTTTTESTTTTTGG